MTPTHNPGSAHRKTRPSLRALGVTLAAAAFIVTGAEAASAGSITHGPSVTSNPYMGGGGATPSPAGHP